MDKSTTPMEGFYATDPHAAEYDKPVNISDIVTGLSCVINSMDDAYSNREDDKDLEGLQAAARVLVAALANRYTGEKVHIKQKRAPCRPPEARTQKPKASVVALVKPMVS